MSNDSEKSAIEALRKHTGGLGGSLTGPQKRAIITGIKNEPENTKPFNPDKFSEGLEKTFKNNPLEWIKF